MKPNLSRERRTSWLLLMAAGLVGSIAVAIAYDWGEAAEQLERARVHHQQIAGPADLADLIAQQQAVNRAVAERIAQRQDEVGIHPLVPFVIPRAGIDAPEYFQILYYTIREDLKNLAMNRGAVKHFDERLGFAFAQGRPPINDPIEQWLTMLQLVSKASYLAGQSRWREIESVEIMPIRAADGVERGAPGRPAMLVEFPFQMRIRGTLRDILWLLHELSADHSLEPTPAAVALRDWRRNLIGKLRDRAGIAIADDDLDQMIGPIAVLGLSIEGGNLSPIDNLQQLEATFELAGMRFIASPDDPDHRDNIDTPQRRPTQQTGRYRGRH